MASYLVTGSSRGFGLALVKELLSFPPEKVGTLYAASRSSTASSELGAMVKADSRLKHLVLDVDDSNSVQRAASEVAQLQKDSGLDVLVNCAGINDVKKSDGKPEHMALEDFKTVMQTNVFAVHDVTLAFLPALRQGKEKKIINIGSTVGSMAYNQRGIYDRAPVPAYKITKATLNALTIQWHFGLQSEGFIVKSVSPGWMKTPLGGEYAPLETKDGAKATLEVIMNEGRETSGHFRQIKIDGVSEQGILLYNGEDAEF